MAKRKKQLLNGVPVKKDQTYCVPRLSKVPIYIRVVHITKGQQPKAFYFRVTKSGQRVGPKRIVASVSLVNNSELKKTFVSNTVPRWLTWRNGAWRLPESWKLVEH